MPHRIVPPNLAELYPLAAQRWGSHPAFVPREKKGYGEPISYAKLWEDGRAFGTALIALGVGARDRVGLLADNRVEWSIADAGVLSAGAATVPRGTDVTDHDIEYILGHAEVGIVIVESAKLAKRVQALHDKLPLIRRVIVMDDDGPDGTLSMASLIADGHARRTAGDRTIEDRLKGIRPDDDTTLIYTSGTTGTPKGVPLTHANMVSQLRLLPISLKSPQHGGERMLSILPIWHSYERVFNIVGLMFGCTTYYTSIRTLADDMKTVKPTIFASAPRLWESLYQRIQAKLAKSSSVQRKMFGLALCVAQMTHTSWAFARGQALDTTGRSPAKAAALAALHESRFIALVIPNLILDAIVLKKVRETLGGEMRGTISGGGALQPHVDLFFNAIGIPILEGYGLTETSPVLAVRQFDFKVLGSVGRVYRETDVRLVDPATGAVIYPDASSPSGGRGKKGEIHVRGPQVFRGYHKNPEATDRVLKDGWFNTGDLGMVTFNDCLKIVGRTKETIVLLNGENVEPNPIEHALIKSPLIQQVMVVGQDRKTLGALVVAELPGLAERGIALEKLEDAWTNEKSRALITAEIKRLVSTENGFKPFELVGDWRALPKVFEPGDELTNTYKLKRHVMNERYAALIDAIYE